MRKNLIIGGLIVWNLILMAALIFVWAGARRTQTSGTTGTSEAGIVPGEQNFT